jgi:hypothetical protein
LLLLPLLPALLLVALVLLLLLLLVCQLGGCWDLTRYQHCSNIIKQHSTRRIWFSSMAGEEAACVAKVWVCHMQMLPIWAYTYGYVHQCATPLHLCEQHSSANAMHAMPAHAHSTPTLLQHSPDIISTAHYNSATHATPADSALHSKIHLCTSDVPATAQLMNAAVQLL